MIKKLPRRICILMKKGAIVSGNTLAPFTCIRRCYLKTKICCCCLIWYVLFCFLRFFFWPIEDNSVSGDNGYRKCILSKCFPKWRLLNTFASRLRIDGRKREVFEYHDVINHMPRVAIVFPSFLNCEDGREL